MGHALRDSHHAVVYHLHGPASGKQAEVRQLRYEHNTSVKRQTTQPAGFSLVSQGAYIRPHHTLCLLFFRGVEWPVL